MVGAIYEPFRETFVKDIKDQGKVVLSGVVLEKSDGGFVLDDGSGRIFVFCDDMEKARVQGFVRVFGRVVFEKEEADVIGEIVQDLDGVNKRAYNKIKGVLGKGV